MDEAYRERRLEFERSFATYEPEGEARVERSPSGRFELTVQRYTAGPSTWDYSRGILREAASGDVLADVKRNYGAFWHAWVEHPDGHEYLLCGEDYQGYSVVDCTTREVHVHFPERGYEGFGFCWADVHPSPDGRMLVVDGCYWACEYELVFYDFRSPAVLPLPELERVEGQWAVSAWTGNGIQVTRNIDVRASDGAVFEDLADEEQDRLLEDLSLLSSRTQTREIDAPALD